MKLLEWKNPDFPNSLRKIPNSPKQIWVDGNINLLTRCSISVVGSRENTEYGAKWCEHFVKELIKYDLVTISGMAIGIDSVVHKSTLKYGGKTIAVLPSGLNNIYPECNANLYKEIIKSGGAVISEYDPITQADQMKFLERNRLVSGLGLGLLVIEAAYRSGTSVTAKLARIQGKDVFCIPR